MRSTRSAKTSQSGRQLSFAANIGHLCDAFFDSAHHGFITEDPQPQGRARSALGWAQRVIQIISHSLKPPRAPGLPSLFALYPPPPGLLYATPHHILPQHQVTAAQRVNWRYLPSPRYFYKARCTNSTLYFHPQLSYPFVPQHHERRTAHQVFQNPRLCCCALLRATLILHCMIPSVSECHQSQRGGRKCHDLSAAPWIT